MIEGPKGFELAKVAMYVGASGWNIEWVPAWVRMSDRVEKPVDAMLIDKDGDYNGFILFFDVDFVAEYEV